MTQEEYAKEIERLKNKLFTCPIGGGMDNATQFFNIMINIARLEIAHHDDLLGHRNYYDPTHLR